jgi:hypothetical protein
MTNHLVLIGTLREDPVIDPQAWDGHASLAFHHAGWSPGRGEPELWETQLDISLRRPPILVQFEPLRKGDLVQVEGSIYALEDGAANTFGVSVETCKLLYRPPQGTECRQEP